MTHEHDKALPGPDDITRIVLPNGIVVLARANFNSPSVVINGYLRRRQPVRPATRSWAWLISPPRP